MDYKFYRKRPADWPAKDHTLAVGSPTFFFFFFFFFFWLGDRGEMRHAP